ncbi:MAG: biotin/lipoyl-binding protein [Chloroflexi bacterium]|nr:biotin/lipoyl-binding protein [Chloroflexota bacterium]
MASRHRFQLGERVHQVVVEEVAEGLRVVIDEGEPVIVDVTTSGVPGLVSMIVEGHPSRAYVARAGGGFRVDVDGRTFEVHPAGGGKRQRGAVGGASDPPGKVSAPLAGVVVEVRVAVGDEVVKGQSLVVIEAMKMQNEVQAPHGGIVTAIHCAKGGRVERGDLLVDYAVAESG